MNQLSQKNLQHLCEQSQLPEENAWGLTAEPEPEPVSESDFLALTSASGVCNSQSEQYCSMVDGAINNN